MKDYILLYMFCALVLIPHTAMAKAKGLNGPVTAEVIRVLDGDTFDVRAQIWVGHFIETRVRLNGLDTPEIRGKCRSEKNKAYAAKNNLSALIQNKKIILTDIKNGKYAGRVLASAQTPEGLDLAKHMITKGFARKYHGKKRKSWC